MAKGFFTQVACVLFREPPTVDDIEPLLAGVVKRREAGRHWEVGGASLLLEYRPELNGYLSVDLVANPWPDDPFGPDASPILSTAWGMGHFGPFAEPGCLERALLHSPPWSNSAQLVAEHAGFVRVRLSYAYGAEPGHRVEAEAVDSSHELRAVLEVLSRLLSHDAAVAGFNPNGELLQPRSSVDAGLKTAHSGGLEPLLELTTNLRHFELEDGRYMVDSVGMAQLDGRDVEACYRVDDRNAGSMDAVIRALCAQQLERGFSLSSGASWAGPDGAPWRAFLIEDGLVPPLRPLIHIEPA